MTLVRPREEDNDNNNTTSTLPIMLSVQQQQPHHHHHHGHHHHHHSHHHGLHASSNQSTGQNHRGNVIVSTNSVPNNENIKNLQQQGCNKKSAKIYAQSGGPYGTVPHQPASVARRNARERNRVKQVNNGFATLRQHIPQSVAQALGSNTAGTHGGSRAGSKKLSKVETLRMAVEYIRSLQRLLDDHDGGGSGGGASAGVVVSAVGSDTVVTSVSSSSSSVSSTSSNSSTRCASNIIGTDIDHRTNNNNSDLHLRHQHLRQNQSPTTFVPAPCSEASSSPTPSFVSDASSAGSQGYGPSSGAIYSNHNDTYDNYEPMSPEDEELLDVISWWQQSQ